MVSAAVLTVHRANQSLSGLIISDLFAIIGMDYHGNICGVTNYVTPDGVDTINLPKACVYDEHLYILFFRCVTAANELIDRTYLTRHRPDAVRILCLRGFMPHRKQLRFM